MARRGFQFEGCWLFIERVVCSSPLFPPFHVRTKFCAHGEQFFYVFMLGDVGALPYFVRMLLL